MHLAYSAPCLSNRQPRLKKQKHTAGYLYRVDAHSYPDDMECPGYRAACEKYRLEIAAIQQYLPGWMPPLHRAGEESL